MKWGKKIFIGIFLVFFLSTGVFAAYLDGYRITAGNGVIKIKDLSFDMGANGLGHKVNNTNAKEVFIPTKTQAEWSSFKSHLPNGVSICNISESTFENWGEWGNCSSVCGGGTQNRTRNCTLSECAETDGCVGNATESRSCNTHSCLPPVNGGWGSWTEWSQCSLSCGGGIQNRTRSCNDPIPSGGGSDCVGLNIETRACNTQVCKTNTTNGICGDSNYTVISEFPANPCSSGIATSIKSAYRWKLEYYMGNTYISDTLYSQEAVDTLIEYLKDHGVFMFKTTPLIRLWEWSCLGGSNAIHKIMSCRACPPEDTAVCDQHNISSSSSGGSVADEKCSWSCGNKTQVCRYRCSQYGPGMVCLASYKECENVDQYSYMYCDMRDRQYALNLGYDPYAGCSNSGTGYLTDSPSWAGQTCVDCL